MQMKKQKNYIVIAILPLILTACVDDQYAIERHYWKTQKQAEKIYKNPHASPPKELERVVEIFERFIQKHPQSNMAIDAEFNIARLYIVKEEYDRSRRQAQKILEKYQANDALCSEAVFLMGNSYQMENKWDAALAQYKRIARDYPVTPKGLEAPIYIAQYYKIKYQPDKMISALQEALTHYQGLSNKYPGTPLAFQADTLVAQCYLELKEWQNAIQTFSSMIETYQDKVAVDGVLLNMALVYSQELKDKPKAKETLQDLIKKYPKGKLVKAASSLLRELDKNE